MTARSLTRASPRQSRRQHPTVGSVRHLGPKQNSQRTPGKLSMGLHQAGERQPRLTGEMSLEGEAAGARRSSDVSQACQARWAPPRASSARIELTMRLLSSSVHAMVHVPAPTSIGVSCGAGGVSGRKTVALRTRPDKNVAGVWEVASDRCRSISSRIGAVTWPTQA